ncbi:SDR family oxidoreductase [Pseudomonas sp. NPDC008258]|uniref:SDR family NAD(P)-dependent oxidoreductase n=1 Tax=Pseudomonas sp. NPDC008258 TaxID=3364418 RepID=UPI0036E48990
MKRPMTVIIGGTSLLGKALSLRFAESQGTVVVASEDVEAGLKLADRISARGGKGVHVHYEPTEDSIRSLIERCKELGGLPDSVVTCPAADHKTPSKNPLDEALRPWAICYESSALASRALAEEMKYVGRGSILNLGSLETLMPQPFTANDKSQSIFSLSQMLAIDFGQFGIRVNSIAPGCALPEMLKSQLEQAWMSPKCHLMSPPLRAVVKPEHVAEAAFFLCSEKAMTITGVMLPVDAGWLLQIAQTAQVAVAK